ncbi:Hypothetical predicted protein [Drosophila guanche]|uniref:40S ribosomal protein S19a n=1 Tax=Drosophila guanche TaxID=7266 RepID=A0A3B0K9M0_DROGU|nr:Hypothetical predicted protein [Drosophila guanche]
MPGATVKEVDQHVLTKVLSDFLKKSGKITVPEQADYIKTAKFKETAPTDRDWFYTRCASIMRHLYFRSPAGVAAFTKVYSGRKRNGVLPAKYCRSSDGCIRMVIVCVASYKTLFHWTIGLFSGFSCTRIGTHD